MQATLNDSAKFDRLAARIGASSSDAKSELRKRFEGDADRIHVLSSTRSWFHLTTGELDA